jgi:hypothetical protein
MVAEFILLPYISLGTLYIKNYSLWPWLAQLILLPYISLGSLYIKNNSLWPWLAQLILLPYIRLGSLYIKKVIAYDLGWYNLFYCRILAKDYYI